MTVLILSIGYATIGNTWVSPATLEVGAGSGLTASAWNSLLANFNVLDIRTAPISSSGGNIGIGLVNPGARLEVAGDIFINGNNVPYKKLVSCNGAIYIQVAAYYPTALNAIWSPVCSNACATIGAGFAGKVTNYVSQTIGTGIPQTCGGVTFYPTHNGGETVNGQAVAQCVCMGW
ncbi:MAG: hypothetical protein PHQ95_01300 [Candidatus Gracilibacteria bacterium]|nr:hypothetical protein [Candidatus Gracilibacteria bacterium]